jgi:type I restriction enzyme S subunit
MKMVELGKICKIVSGSTPSRNTPEFWDGDIHWFTPKDLSGLASKYVYEAPEKITKEGFRSCSTNLIPSNSLLFSSRAPIGHLAINKLECCTNQGFKTMIPSENLNVEYLYYAIKRIVPQLQDMGNGATFKELSKSTFEKVEIPLPPLATQQKIAAILDAADAYRQKTKTLIAKYDQLAQSLFLDMFGDTWTNPKGWKVMLVEDVSNNKKHSIKAGPFGSSLKKEFYVEKGYKIYGQEQVIKDDLSFGDYYIDEKKYKELENCKVSEGDVLISLVGTYGKISVVPENFEPGIINPRLMKISPNRNIIRSDFLKILLQNSGAEIQMKNQSRGGTMDIVNVGIMRKIEIPVPPIELQNKFAERAQLLEAQKQQAQASLQKAEELFNSLLYRCFDSAQQPVTAP